MTDINGLIELDLTDTEAEKLHACNKDVGTSSRLAAQKAYLFAETMTTMINAVNAGNEAQNEYIRQLSRIAKSRARQPEDITDVDIQNKKIVFKKNKRDLAKLTVVPDEAEDTE